MVDRSTSIPGNQIENDSVKQDELDITNTPSDNDILQINMPTGDFTAKALKEMSDYQKLQDNIALNSFRIAVDGSRTIFNMIDGIVDYYVDESGIDTVNSLNEDYDSTNDLYSPSSADGLTVSPYAHYKCNDNAANTTVTDNGTGTNNGVANVNTSNYSVSGKINQAFELNGTTEYINVNGLEADIDSDTTGSFSIWLNPDAIGGYIFEISDTNANNRFYINPTGSVLTVGCVTVAGSNRWYHTGGTLSIGTWHHIVVVQDDISPKIYIDGTDVTNLSITTDTTWWFADNTAELDMATIGANYHTGGFYEGFFDGKIDDFRYYQNKALTQAEINAIYNAGVGTEADQPEGDLNNMTLISDTFTAEAEPDTARIVILEEDVDAITINTDLKAWATKDAGSNWIQGTLIDEGDFDASKRILTANFALANTGTSMEYKITSLNEKDLKIHATSLNWA